MPILNFGVASPWLGDAALAVLVLGRPKRPLSSLLMAKMLILREKDFTISASLASGPFSKYSLKRSASRWLIRPHILSVATRRRHLVRLSSSRWKLENHSSS